MRIYILYISTIVSIVTYSFWGYMPKGSFYIGNSLFILLICLYVFLSDKKSFIKFIIFSLSLNNFLDELFFDNTKFGLNELAFSLTVLILSIIKYRNDRKRPKLNKRIN